MKRGRKATPPEDREVYCRDCGVPLCRANVRLDGTKWVGLCRQCESYAARLRRLKTVPAAGVYTDSRRKYPVREP